VHLNRLVKKYDLNMIYISGPGHGAPATLSNAYLQEKIRYEDQSDPFPYSFRGVGCGKILSVKSKWEHKISLGWPNFRSFRL
jgi:hypothetical protein